MLRTVKQLVKKAIELTSGFTWHDYYLLRSLRHFWWLYPWAFSYRTTIRLPRIERVAPNAASDSSVELCERISKAYRLAVEDPGPECDVSSMWQTHMEAKYGRLKSLLGGEPRPLAEALASMFSSEMVSGIDTGDLYRGRNWRVYSRRTLDDLVSLAEQLGVRRTESGGTIIGGAFSAGLPKLLRDTEAALGCSLDVPRIGAPYGVVIDGTLLTIQSCEYAYVALRLSQALQDRLGTNAVSVLEIGGGYGGAAMFVARLMPVASYTIADLPIVNVLQASFLGSVFGGHAVNLFGENRLARFSIIPGTSVKRLGRVGALFNENSMPELPLEASTSYLRWARENVQLFFSYNHETISPSGKGAIATVSEIVGQVDGFARKSRNYSWLRPGYTEEIWVPTSNTPGR